VKKKPDKTAEYKYIKIYRDKESGYTTKDRPGFIEMMNDAEAGMFDIVIVWKLDRYSRRSIDLQTNYESLREHKVDLISVGQDIDFSSINGTFFLQMLAAVAEMERQMIKERMYGARIRKAQSGIPTTKKFPFGRTFNFDTNEWEVDDNKK